MSPETSDPIEHQNVPQAHRGLHDFLYSSTDEHSVEPTVAPAVESAVDTPLAISDWCEQAQTAKVAGVYAVLNSTGQTQFIGYSRNVALSLRSHVTQKGDDVCAMVTVQPFKFPKRDAMEKLRDEWIAALPSPPPGNLDGTWAKSIKEAATQVMSTAERETYEEKKLKLRRAMADGSLQAGEKTQANQRQDLAAAMNDDNWSAVIREQTQETQS
ncbi:GIY-YIG nuclease family protein [Leptolyngbya cf. ectocarpi LEGE 11479]|uniref:GIY-YIG nuclease family protein n=1 Tax=Leptolyngbya cf. ectocarpi LEGE 11479 TaxID=1828722 RepID=A0A928ZYN0_LEPEC|nr:GIY-YIG nuclease family protein [Leptolyngbya ectocarpi]MBE9069850.1 GIY-YIG nuclease family protein [Leptolyngbya cf. ectocarpi LEGE 11479]